MEGEEHSNSMAEAAKFSLEYQQQSLLTQAAPPTTVNPSKQ